MRKLILFTLLPFTLMSQTTYVLKAGTFSSGSGGSSNSNYTLTSVFGLPAMDISSNSTYTLFGGMPYPGIYVIAEESNPALKFKMLPLSPNPAHSRVLISFVLPGRQNVSVTIFDVSGRKVWSYESIMGAGRHEIVWDTRTAGGTRVKSGIYFVRFRADKREVRQKLLIVR